MVILEKNYQRPFFNNNSAIQVNLVLLKLHLDGIYFLFKSLINIIIVNLEEEKT
jgi:hypothetical protein